MDLENLRKTSDAEAQSLIQNISCEPTELIHLENIQKHFDPEVTSTSQGVSSCETAELSNLENTGKHFEAEISSIAQSVSHESMDLSQEAQKPVEELKSSSEFKMSSLKETKALKRAKKQKLNKCKKKRFKWLLEHGHTREEAFQLCLKPILNRNIPRKPTADESLPELYWNKVQRKHVQTLKPRSKGGNSLCLESSQRAQNRGQDGLSFHTKRMRAPAGSIPLDVLFGSNPVVLSSLRYLTENQSLVQPKLNPLYNRRRIPDSPLDKKPRSRISYLRYKSLDLKSQCNGRAQMITSKDSSEKSVPEGVGIGILHADYPKKLLNNDDVEAIQNFVLNLIMDEEDKTVHPGFYSISKRDGYLILNCKDEATVDWLKTKEETLVPWEGAVLKIVREEKILNPIEVKGYFEDSIQDTSERILKFVEVQNEGMKATVWKVLQRDEVGKQVVLTVLLDNEAADRLKKNGPLVNFKFNKAVLNINKTVPL